MDLLKQILKGGDAIMKKSIGLNPSMRNSLREVEQILKENENDFSDQELKKFLCKVRQALENGVKKFGGSEVLLKRLLGPKWFTGNIIKYATRISTMDDSKKIQEDAVKTAAYAFLVYRDYEDFNND